MSWVIVVSCSEEKWPQYQELVQNIRGVGKWSHDIVCLPLPELVSKDDFKTFNQTYNVISKEFDPIITERRIIRNVPSHKFHKLHSFDEYFQKWNWIFQIEVDCKIRGDLNRFRELLLSPEYIHAHSDPYPMYNTSLETQFLDIEPFTSELKELGPLNINFFQSFIFIFASSLVTSETKSELIKIANRFPICHTHEQGTLAIYFCLLQKKWKQLPICDEHGYLYDFWARFGIPKDKYVISAIE
jgi:hypothetical protein